MGIKRGNWESENPNKIATTLKPTKFGARPVNITDGITNSEKHLLNKQKKDPIAISGISDERREELIRITNQRDNLSGKIQVPAPVIANSVSYKTSQEIKNKYGLNKNASIVSPTNNLGLGSGDVSRVAPEVYSPLFQMANLQLPRERLTMNAWNRNFYMTHPLVHNCINLHATYPINKINIKCKNFKVEQFFNEMAEEIDLIGVLQSVASEYWCIGEAYPYATLDETKGKWKEISLQNPDFIHVQMSVLGGEPVISLVPDSTLKRLANSNNPTDIHLRSQISEEMLYHIRKGNNIPLDNFNVSHLKNSASPYDIHGTSIIVSVYKDLMLYDKLRESKFAQADNLVNPITLVQVGGASEGEYHPTEADLEKWRQIFEAASYDRDFKIISHAGIKIDRIGASGAIIDISQDMNFILDNILYGLMIPKAIITQDGAGFNSPSIGLEVLKQRYESFRNMMAKWLVKKIFAPICEIQEFYEYRDGERKLILPEIEWNKLVLYDMNDYISNIKDLANNNKVSKSTLYKSLGLNMEEEMRSIKEEMIKDTILAKEVEIMKGMTLGSLRALKADEDIIEPTEAPLPGTPGSIGAEESGIPGVGAPGGGGDLLGGFGGPGMTGMEAGSSPMAGGIGSPGPGPGAGDLGPTPTI